MKAIVNAEELKLGIRTRALAEGIAADPPIALRYVKENLNRALAVDLDPDNS